MNKVILNFEKNQARNKNIFISRAFRRSKAFHKLYKEGYDPIAMYQEIAYHKERNTITYRILKYVLFLASKGMYAFPSIAHLQMICAYEDGTVPHPKSICRVTAQLADMGYIRKWSRGFFQENRRRSPVLLLNRVFNNPVLQYLIAPLFSFMVFASMSFWYAPQTLCKENFNFRTTCPVSSDVTYNETSVNLNKNGTDKVYVERDRYTVRGGFYNAREALGEKKSMAELVTSILGKIAPKNVPKEQFALTPSERHLLQQPATVKNKGFVAPSPTGYSGSDRSDADKYPYSSYIDELPELKQLNLTSFGKMKLSVIPQGVVHSLYKYYVNQGSNLPHNERFFQECLDICKRENIDLGSRWSRFYDACDKRGINAKKESPVHYSRPAEVSVSVERPAEDESAFWRLEMHWMENERGYQVLGCPANPFESIIHANGTQHQELFDMYVAGKKDPESRRRYHEALKRYNKLLLFSGS